MPNVHELDNAVRVISSGVCLSVDIIFWDDPILWVIINIYNYFDYFIW